MIPIHTEKKRLDDFFNRKPRKPAITTCTAAPSADEELFELEMKHIFRGQLDLSGARKPDSQHQRLLHHPHRPPSRLSLPATRQGELNAFINACTHRGARLCRFKKGNKATYACPFHGWTFNDRRQTFESERPDEAGYPECFNKEGSHDLKKVARFESSAAFSSAASTPM